MSKTCGVAYSNDQEIIELCMEVGKRIGFEWIAEHILVDFLLKLQDNDFQVIFFDCDPADSDCVKWITFIRSLRPKIPLIIASQKQNKQSFAKLIEQGVFYVCLRPIHEDVLYEVLLSALKTNNSKKGGAVCID